MRKVSDFFEILFKRRNGTLKRNVSRNMRNKKISFSQDGLRPGFFYKMSLNESTRPYTNFTVHTIYYEGKDIVTQTLTH